MYSFFNIGQTMHSHHVVSRAVGVFKNSPCQKFGGAKNHEKIDFFCIYKNMLRLVFRGRFLTRQAAAPITAAEFSEIMATRFPEALKSPGIGASLRFLWLFLN
jgi:hypothetical protein